MPPEKHEAARDAGPLCTETASAVNEEMDILSRRIFILIAAVAALLLPGGMLKAETAPVVKDGLRGIVTDIVTGEPLIGAGILVWGLDFAQQLLPLSHYLSVVEPGCRGEGVVREFLSPPVVAYE